MVRVGGVGIVLPLLPLSPGELKNAKQRVLAEMVSTGLTSQEAKIKLEADFSDWLNETRNQLPDSVASMLHGARWFEQLRHPREATPGKSYERLVEKLSSQGNVGRRTGAISSSYLPLIVRLVGEFQMSAAGVAEIINESDQRLLLHWKSLDKMLSVLGLGQGLEMEEFERLLSNDRLLSADVFKDADTEVIVEMICREADLFELGKEFASAIRQLLKPESGSPFVPYLQTLFYLCAITEFFDHPLEYLYTFKPRGRVALKIYSVFPREMSAAGNPILNNFKAIDRLSHDWARSRDDYPLQADALVTLVLGLSSLSYSSRRFLAQRLRGALIRYIEIVRPEKIELAEVKNIRHVENFPTRVARCETNTRGVIEQRVCDFLSQLSHLGHQWRARGLGDPVNATNTASRKLGDADFQNVALRCCVAVEAHAGRLTPVYVDEHLRTFRRNFPMRIEEWERIADLREWSLNVIFVVHEDHSGSDFPTELEGISFKLEVVSFGDFIEQAMSKHGLADGAVLAEFNRHVIAVLAADNTPHEVKLKTKELLA